MYHSQSETDTVENIYGLFTRIGCPEGDYSIKIGKTVHPPGKVLLEIKEKLKAE